MAFTLEQQQAIAIASARARLAGQENAAAPAEPPQEQTLMDRLRGVVSTAQDDAAAIKEAYNSGRISNERASLDSIGKLGVKPVFGALGEIGMSGIDALSGLFPQGYKDATARYMNAAANTDIGKSALAGIGTAVKGYGDWATANPDDARTLESVVNIATFGIPSRALGKTVAGEIGEGFEKWGAKQIAAQRRKAALDSVLPEKVKDMSGKFRQEGVMRENVYKPSKRETEIVETVMEIPEFSQKKSFQGNLDSINDTIGKEAKYLKSALEKEDISLIRQKPSKTPVTSDKFGSKIYGERIDYEPHHGFDDVIEEAIIEIDPRRTLTGDAQKQFERMAEHMKKFVDQNPPTTAGLLQARKDFDNWITGEKPKIFDQNFESAASAANRIIRQKANDFIAANTKSVDVKKSLRKQNLLFEAADNLTPRARAEADTALKRFIEKAGKALPGNSALAKLGSVILGGAATVGTAALSPSLAVGAATAGGLYGGLKALNSPIVKKTLGKALKATDKTIKLGKDARADRAIILDLMKDDEQENK
jgi:hypothetical protein